MSESPDVNIIGNTKQTTVSGGIGFIIGIVVTVLFLMLIGADFSDEVEAQDASAAPEVPEYTTERGQFVYSWVHNWMAATGMDDGDINEEFVNLGDWHNGLTEADLDDLAEAHLASAGIQALQGEMSDGDFLDLNDDGE